MNMKVYTTPTGLLSIDYLLGRAGIHRTGRCSMCGREYSRGRRVR